MASSFSALIDLESSLSTIANPPRAISTVQKSPSAFELDALTFGNRYNGPHSALGSGVRTPATTNELESSFQPDHATTYMV